MHFPSFRHLLLPTLAALMVTSAAAAQTTGVSVQFHNDGTVSLQARNAPLRTILQEWARAGRTTFINAERITGAPMTIELTHVTERDALATLLRGTSGYIIGARPEIAAGASLYDRVMVLPQSSTPPTARVVSNAPLPTPPPPAPIAFVPGDPEDAPLDPNGRVLTAQQLQQQLAARAAAAQQQIQQQNAPPQDQMARPVTQPTTTPANPFFSGTSGRPGEVAPVPQQPRNPLRPNGDPEP